MPQYSGIVNIAMRAAYLAANVISLGIKNKKNNIPLTKKGHNDFATEVDKESEQIIIDTIKKSYPSHNFICEESGTEDNHSDCTWIIDPIDGTTNFMHGHPQYCISIAFKEGDKITCGIILDPTRNDLYRAQLGKGAFLNDKRLRVTTTRYLEEALLATGFPTYNMERIDKYMAIFKDMLLYTQGQRRQGSAALDLAYVAAGYLDGFWEFNLKPWDIAAGYLLVKEAGGSVNDFQNKQNFWDSGDIVAANPKLTNQILKIIQSHL